mmetsp:Transcript_30599/g.40714  ORF Transcript_30599/g.40714 Transcript_30599/m.40714 type:complete len:120 (+) Transcript_30599:2691-3050(+)
MMASFNRLQDQLNSQQQQLVSLIKQVNALIDHRDKKEGQMLRSGANKDFKVIKAKAAMQKKSMSYQVDVSDRDMLPKASRKVPQPIEETKGLEGDKSASARDRAHEQELKAINEGYMNG